MPNPNQASGFRFVKYSIIRSAAKPIIAARPLNSSAKRLKPNLVTTNLGWTVGCGFAMMEVLRFVNRSNLYFTAVWLDAPDLTRKSVPVREIASSQQNIFKY
jgi:hypothetical protein